MASLLVGTALALLAAAPASALPLAPGTYAISDYSPTGHGVWFKRFSDENNPSRFTFQSGSTFSYDGSTATINAEIRDKNDANRGFDIMMTLNQISAADVVIRGLSGKCEQNDCDTSHWKYFDLDMGMFTGLGDLNGLDLNLVQIPADGSFPWQVGENADSKTKRSDLIVLGAAMWFDWNIKDTNTSGVDVCGSGLFNCGNDTHGDFNIHLTLLPGITFMSEPGTLTLLGFGLAGLGLAARRKMAAQR